MRSAGPVAVLTWLLILAAISCTGRHPQEPAVPPPDQPQKGVVCPDIRCIKNNRIGYSLYLPKSYDPIGRYPVLFLFDPHGSGNFPVEKYKHLADRYGYILAGSNDSRNGLPLSETGIIVRDLFEDVLSRFSADSSRIYTAGFSGGSRIASLIALYQYGIAGVTGCGAGFPFSAEKPKARFDYIGIAGNSDFNLNELMALDQELEAAGFRHALLVFNGGHAWPPDKVMEEAFVWNDLCAMKEGKLERNTEMIDGIVTKSEAIASKDDAAMDPLERYRDLQNAVRFLKGLTPTASLETSLKTLERSSAYQKALKRETAALQEEQRQQRTMTDGFFTEGLPWWEKRIDGLNRTLATSADSNEVRMCRRLKSYLSLVCYMSYTRMAGAGDTAAAAHAMKIYEMADPENAAKTKAGKDQ